MAGGFCGNVKDLVAGSFLELLQVCVAKTADDFVFTRPDGKPVLDFPRALGEPDNVGGLRGSAVP